MNSQDFVDGGLSGDEAIRIAAILAESGIDAVELSGGTSYSGKLTPVRPGKLDSRDEEVYYRSEAEKYKKSVSVPLMLVGGIRSFEVAERLVEDGTTDYISLCRPLICESNLIERWKVGITSKSACISCNGCIKGEAVRCVLASSPARP